MPLAAQQHSRVRSRWRLRGVRLLVLDVIRLVLLVELSSKRRPWSQAVAPKTVHRNVSAEHSEPQSPYKATEKIGHRHPCQPNARKLHPSRPIRVVGIPLHTQVFMHKPSKPSRQPYEKAGINAGAATREPATPAKVLAPNDALGHAGSPACDDVT